MGKPPDGQYTRKGEADGKRLSPGERAINWAKAFAIVIPLLGIGWASNSQTVKDLVYTEPNTKPVVSDEQPIQHTQCPDVRVTCPEINLSNLLGSIDNHEKRFHE